MNNMAETYETDEKGYLAFVAHLENIAKVSLEWESLLPEDGKNLRKALEFLGRHEELVNRDGQIAYGPLWRVVGAAFMIGASGTRSLSAKKYDNIVSGTKATDAKKAKRQLGGTKDAIIDDIVSKYMEKPAKSVLNEVNKELQEKGCRKLAASTLAYRRTKVKQKQISNSFLASDRS